ncbi:MAG: ABC transporter permease [Tissierellales bacterium]|nr:ABC transporter permease [Tissierellales bacterium]
MSEYQGTKSTLVRFYFTAKMALNGLTSNMLRTSLTVLGILIGVASVVSLMGIGEGARQTVVEHTMCRQAGPQSRASSWGVKLYLTFKSILV